MIKEFKIQDYFFFAILAGALILSFFMFLPFFTPLFLAVVTAALFFPFHKKISGWISKGNTSSFLSSLVSLIVIVLIVLIPLTLVSVKISMEAKSVYDYYTSANTSIPVVDNLVGNIQKMVLKVMPGADVSAISAANFKEYITQLSGTIFSNIDSLFSSAAKIFFEFIVFIIALFYFLKDGASIKSHAVKISPLADAQDEEIVKRMKTAVNSVLKGTLLVAFIQGVIAFFGFLIFSLPNPTLWAVTAMFAALIPGIGTSLVLIPAIVYLFIKGYLIAAVGLLIWGALAVGMVDNFLAPRLIGKNAGIHPLVVLISAVGGVSLFGALGFIAGPLLVSFVMVLISVYKFSVEK
jgi:predicted PurR-regulated permease PerM